MTIPDAVPPPEENCATCEHPIGKHFQDVIGKVRCLAVEGWNSRMTGEYSTRECSCVDYVLTDPYRKPVKR